MRYELVKIQYVSRCHATDNIDLKIYFLIILVLFARVLLQLVDILSGLLLF